MNHMVKYASELEHKHGLLTAFFNLTHLSLLQWLYIASILKNFTGVCLLVVIIPTIQPGEPAMHIHIVLLF